MTVDDLLDRADKEIRKSRNVDLWRPSDARVNAEEILAEVIGKPVRSATLDEEVTSAQARRFEKLVKRRVAGEPVALIVGFTEFRGMRLLVRKGVFVPRTSSELMASKAVRRLARRAKPVAVDVATGIGPVALALAKTVPGAAVYGLDIWPPSLKVARENAERLKLKATFIQSDMLSKMPPALKGKVDVFTCHPPYVAKSQVRTLPKEVRDFEPKVSLSDNSPDGLGMVQTLAEHAPAWLRPGGWLLIEVSPDLSRGVSKIMRTAGFDQVKSERDSLGATRVISGRNEAAGARI